MQGLLYFSARPFGVNREAAMTMPTIGAIDPNSPANQNDSFRYLLVEACRFGERYPGVKIHFVLTLTRSGADRIHTTTTSWGEALETARQLEQRRPEIRTFRNGKQISFWWLDMDVPGASG